ncbi:MAG: CoA transferase [Oscillospiraceae bacterium]|nr:CoA transferase [Oscillospiraceae bacterium]
MSEKALQGIKVLDFTSVLAGPYCSMMLGNMGAEIYKVEKPQGDDSRTFGPHVGGMSTYFLSLNRGKKSIVCDTRSEQGKEAFKRLAAEVDILVENLKPGAMERMGLGYDTLKEINPRLIYVAVSGFGHSGPYSSRAAYDLIAQAMGGIISITGTPGEAPVRVGASVGDIMAGMFAAFGAVSALYQRVASGTGQKVDVAMLDSQIAMLENAIAKYSANGIVPQPIGLRHPVITPFDGFETKDGHIIVACGNDRLFRALCEVLDLESLPQDERFLTNALRTEHIDALTPIIAQTLRTNTTAHWMELLLAKNVPCGPINTIDKLFEDPQVAARNMLVEVEQPDVGKIKLAGNPVKMSPVEAADEVSHDPAPEIGSHTREVLIDLLGYSAEEAEAYMDSIGG